MQKGVVPMKRYFLLLTILLMVCVGCEQNSNVKTQDVDTQDLNTEYTQQDNKNNNSEADEIGHTRNFKPLQKNGDIAVFYKEVSWNDIAEIDNHLVDLDCTNIQKVVVCYPKDINLYTLISVDLENGECYMGIPPKYIELEEPTCYLDDNRIEEFRGLINKYVKKWDANYGPGFSKEYESTDQVDWVIYVAYTDGSVEKYYGAGPSLTMCSPEDFYTFKRKVDQFILDVLDD